MQRATWWMTKGVEPDDSYIPVRDEKEEIAAIIELIGIANEAVKKPVFLAIGNDLGVLTSKVISALGAEGTLGHRNGYAKLFHSRECNRHIASIDKFTFVIFF
jgi:hypothetical protein